MIEQDYLFLQEKPDFSLLGNVPKPDRNQVLRFKETYDLLT
jgi:hypothetical protein